MVILTEKHPLVGLLEPLYTFDSGMCSGIHFGFSLMNSKKQECVVMGLVIRWEHEMSKTSY